MSDSKKVLVIGDFLASTGFGTVNTGLLRAIKAQSNDYAFYILGINATGDPHPLREEFPHVFPAATEKDHDLYGMARVAEVCDAVQPDLIFINADAWLVNIYMKVLALKPHHAKIPVVAWCPPDAKNQPSGAHLTAQGLKHLVTPTQFGRDELVAGGFDGPTSVIPYGIDPKFAPLGTTRDARMRLLYHERFLDAFVVGRADRNVHRKRYDLTFEGFAQAWQELGKPDDLALYCHCQIVSPQGYDLPDLARYYGIRGQVMSTYEGFREGRGIPEAMMPDIYRAWDVHLSTAMGEGFGFSGFESAACGVPQILVDYSAYGEYFKEAARMLPVQPGWHTTIGGPNTLGAVTPVESVAQEIVDAYVDRAEIAALGPVARAVTERPEFTWPVCGAAMLKVWNEVLNV